MKRKRSIVAGMLACAGVALVVHAGMVVDFNLPAAQVALNRAKDADTGLTRTWNFNAATPLFNGSGGNNRFFGGIYASSAAALSADTTANYLGAAGTQQGIRIQTSSGSAQAVTEKCLLLWDKADFLTSDNYFGTSASSSLSLTIDTFSGTPKGLRYVVRNGSTYYVSETGVTGTGTFSLTGTDAKWGQFTESNFYLFLNSDAGAGMGVASYSAMTFTNVTGVGVIFDDTRTAAQGPVIRISDFQATLIPEPATIGMLGLGALVTFLFRRMRAR